MTCSLSFVLWAVVCVAVASKAIRSMRRPTTQSSVSASGLTNLLKIPIGATPPTQQKRAKPKVFTRINRSEGLVQWIDELNLLRRQMQDGGGDALPAAAGPGSPPSAATFIELSKVLLHSGSPEQAIELYSAYYDLVVCGSSGSDAGKDVLRFSAGCSVEGDASSPPVVPEVKMVLVAVRAHIALGDVAGALSLVSACNRLGLAFDDDSQSTLMHDLAESSAEGLKAALDMREAVRQRGGRINSAGIAGLLRGIWTHGMKAIREGARLLMDPSFEERALSEERSSSFRLSAAGAETLAHELMQEWRAGVLSSGGGGKSATKAALRRIDAEFLRVLFRVGQRECKPALNHNYESDKRAEEENESMEGIKKSVQAMAQYSIGWDSSVTDTLIDECLRCGGLEASKFITVQMNVQGIHARTSTFNAVLRRYASNGDGESAYLLLKEMRQAEQTAPDADSYALLLESFAKSEKCRFYAKEVIQELSSGGAMSKAIFDRWIELRILSSEPYADVVEAMTRAGTQPDGATAELMMGAFRRAGSWEGALALHQLQARAETKRRQFRRDTLEDFFRSPPSTSPSPSPSPSPSSSSSPASSSSSAAAAAAARKDPRESLANLDAVTRSLPPSYRSTTHALLELLRDCGRHAESRAVLADMCRWIDKNPAVAPASAVASTMRPSTPVLPVSLTSSSRFTLAALYAPDVTTFALVMEAIVGSPGSISRSTSTSTSSSTARSNSTELSPLEAAGQALEAFAEMERWGLAPDRRVYASLIRAFSLRGDIPSALGVFEEALGRFSPDVSSLQSVLDACLTRPESLRTLVVTLEGMASRPDLDLTVFCGDVLMQGFDDARALGAALVGMEGRCEEARRTGLEVVQCSLPVLSVLLQASRKGTSARHLADALLFLGSAGIAPEADSMEYFRIDAPGVGDPFSSQYHKKLVPHSKKQRSLLDMDLPEGLNDGLGGVNQLPSRGPQRSAAAIEAEMEPLFLEPGRRSDIYAQHARILARTLHSAADNDLTDSAADQDEDDDDADLTEEQRLTLAEAAFAWAEREGEGEGAGAGAGEGVIELGEQFLMQRSPLKRKK